MAASDWDTIIYTPATASGQSTEFVVRDRPLTVYIYGTHVATENWDLQRQGPDGTFRDEYDFNAGGTSAQVVLADTRTSLTVSKAGTYRLNKDTTTNAVGAAVTEAPHGTSGTS